jgi:hypothetical protein
VADERSEPCYVFDVPDQGAHERAGAHGPGTRAARWLSGLAAIAFIAFITFVAGRPGLASVLFPELAALAYDVFRRPRGAWARAPGALVATPFLTAMLGTLITRHFEYGVASVLFIVGVTVALIKVLRSPIAPAISAALLPLTLGTRTWWYPPSVLFGSGLLASLVTARSHLLSRCTPPSTTPDDITEPGPTGADWLVPYSVIIVLLAFTANVTGWRFVLFPPLAVIGFEMFAHPTVCPWAKRPIALPIACTISAAAGIVAVQGLGGGALAAACTTAIGAVALSVLGVHVPPALAVGLLPFVIERPSYWFIVAVAAGASLMTASFVAWRRFLAANRRAVLPAGPPPNSRDM